MRLTTILGSHYCLADNICRLLGDFINYGQGDILVRTIFSLVVIVKLMYFLNKGGA